MYYTWFGSLEWLELCGCNNRVICPVVALCNHVRYWERWYGGSGEMRSRSSMGNLVVRMSRVFLPEFARS